MLSYFKQQGNENKSYSKGNDLFNGEKKKIKSKINNNNKMENTNNTGKVILALLVGAAVGGALGILLAPQSGKETRKKIAGKTDDFTKSLKSKFNSLIGEAKAEFQNAQDSAESKSPLGGNFNKTS